MTSKFNAIVRKMDEKQKFDPKKTNVFSLCHKGAKICILGMFGSTI